jgi:hypothetical protein
MRVLENRWLRHQPTDRQAEFLLRSDVREALYGGGGGGAKSGGVNPAPWRSQHLAGPSTCGLPGDRRC